MPVRRTAGDEPRGGLASEASLPITSGSIAELGAIAFLYIVDRGKVLQQRRGASVGILVPIPVGLDILETGKGKSLGFVIGFAE
jgi:hypothetical protein